MSSSPSTTSAPATPRLGRLLEIPATTLKVDQSFTRGLSGNRDAAAVVSAVLLLGHNLRRTVIVEGVENAETLEALQEAGCTHVQGYHLSRPESAEELEAELVDPPWAVRAARPRLLTPPGSARPAAEHGDTRPDRA